MPCECALVLCWIVVGLSIDFAGLLHTPPRLPPGAGDRSKAKERKEKPKGEDGRLGKREATLLCGFVQRDNG